MEWDKQQPLLTPEEQRILLEFSKQTLAACFKNQEDALLEAFEKDTVKSHPHFSLKLSCFVTLYSGRDKNLRGCIGSQSTTQTLYENVWEYTQAAAFSDSRFPQVEQSELKDISVGISVLGPSRPLKHKEDLVVGKHGISVDCGKKHGVFLAHVATEWNWDRDELIKQTCIKAGLKPGFLPEYTFSYFEEITF